MTSSEESEYESEQEEEEVPQHTEVVASRTEDVVDDLNYDGYNLTASSYHPLRWSSDSKREKVILEATSRAAQLLFKK